jgi:predicted nucleic acid-binding Zn ribbon protein
MSAPAVILIKMNRYIRIFREAGATNPSQSIIPEEHGIRNSYIFKKLVRKGILIPVDDQRYYLDEVKEADDRKRRRTMVSILLLLIVALIIFGVFKM